MLSFARTRIPIPTKAWWASKLLPCLSYNSRPSLFPSLPTLKSYTSTITHIPETTQEVPSISSHADLIAQIKENRDIEKKAEEKEAKRKSTAWGNRLVGVAMGITLMAVVPWPTRTPRGYITVPYDDGPRGSVGGPPETRVEIAARRRKHAWQFLMDHFPLTPVQYKLALLMDDDCMDLLLSIFEEASGGISERTKTLQAAFDKKVKAHIAAKNRMSAPGQVAPSDGPPYARHRVPVHKESNI